MSITIEGLPYNPVFDALQKLHLVTKHLKFQAIRKGRIEKKLVVSTQFLSQMNFNKGDSLIEQVIGKGKGLFIRKTAIGEPSEKRVYEREYKRSKRKETYLDIRHQGKISEAFTGATEARIKITPKGIWITPVFRSDAHNRQGASIKLPSLTQCRDAIVSALETIRNHKLTCAIIEFTDSQFKETQDFILLKTQLRRDGFTIEDQEQGIKVYFDGHKDLDTPPIPLINPQTIKAPPAIKSLDAFVGFSAGIDASALEAAGFQVTHGLEYRVPEKRDNSDKSEMYALSLAINSSLTTLHNEDVYKADTQFIGKNSAGISHAHYSLPCTEFSPLKNKAAREKAVEDLNTSRDMFIPLLDIIKNQKSPTISVENVPQFLGSCEFEIFESRLIKLGYSVHCHVLNGKDYYGHSNRNRLHIFATLLDCPFTPPAPSKHPIKAWDIVKNIGLEQARNVTHTKSVQKGIETGRIRPMTEGSEYSPCITRSQSRQTKDTMYLLIDDQYYLPSIEHLRALMCIPESFNMSFLNSELTTEVIGQSVSWNLHKQWCLSIKNHINAFIDKTKQNTILTKQIPLF